jgi:hypothetical protein
MSEVGLVPFARVALEVSRELVPAYSHIVFLRNVSRSRNCWQFCV